jgi:hypothetical protein
MQYLVQLRAAVQQANKIDAGEGPGPTFAKIIDRFHSKPLYQTPDHRSLIMFINLYTPVQRAALMYALTWFTGSEPTFTPIMKLEVYGEAIANAKRILSPPTT